MRSNGLMNTIQDNGKYMRPYYALRKAVGILGVALPFILLFTSLLSTCEVFPSVSKYYHYNDFTRNIFVAILSIIGIFLFFYVGYDRRDNILGNVASFFALATAFIPTTEINNEEMFSIRGAIHISCAIGFFICLIIFAYSQFTQTTPGTKPSQEKLKRNRIYRWCAYIMAIPGLGAVVLFCIGLGVPSVKIFMQKTPFLYIVETIMLIAFGVAWLVKGDALFRDKKA